MGCFLACKEACDETLWVIEKDMHHCETGSKLEHGDSEGQHEDDD
jgi:hypothetical protein